MGIKRTPIPCEVGAFVIQYACLGRLHHKGYVVARVHLLVAGALFYLDNNLDFQSKGKPSEFNMSVSDKTEIRDIISVIS